MPARAAPLPWLLLLVVLVAEPAVAQIDGPTLTTDGSVLSVAGADRLERGAEVVVTFRNQGDGPHDLFVVRGTSADEGRNDTSPDEVLAAVAGVPADAERKIVIEVPQDASSLFFWCDMPGHEAAGEWLKVLTVEKAPLPEPAPKGAPAAPLGLLVLTLLVVGRGRRGRR